MIDPCPYFTLGFRVLRKYGIVLSYSHRISKYTKYNRNFIYFIKTSVSQNILSRHHQYIVSQVAKNTATEQKYCFLWSFSYISGISYEYVVVSRKRFNY